jgi:trans-2,3-dihydro-3-hydroxyanthranilate isomerase
MNEKKSYRYDVADLFTQTPLEGNPMAVFSDAGDFDAPTMQRIAPSPSMEIA